MDQLQPESPVDGSRTEGQIADQPAERLHVRWFLIPLGIVALLVGGWWLLFRLLAGPPDPLELIENMRDPSRESWQQAYAFVELLRDPQSTELRSDRAVCRAVADILAGSLDRGRRRSRGGEVSGLSLPRSGRVSRCRWTAGAVAGGGAAIRSNALQVRCAADRVDRRLGQSRPLDRLAGFCIAWSRSC